MTTKKANRERAIKTQSLILSLACVVYATLSGCARGGNATHGKELYAACQACHKPAENYVGPKHCNLFGRAAGSVRGFDYSEAMRASGITWTEKTLNEWLTSPVAYVNGTKMGFAGFESPTDRADVIAYLKKMNNDPALCPKS